MQRFRTRFRWPSLFDPGLLFVNGEQGAWYDPSDFSTLFQDAAGTTPVTAVGQPVGRILDKSGRGNHATQSTSTSRPILQQDGTGRYYLSFDGVDDWLSTASVDFTATDKMAVFVGVRKLTDSLDQQTIVELSANSSSVAGAFAVQGSPAFALKYRLQLFGSSRGVRDTPGSTFAAPNTSVISSIMDISQSVISSELLGRFNGAVISMTDVLSPAGTGNFGNHSLFVGRRGGTAFPFNGRIYGLIIRGAASNTSQIEAAERYMNSKTGAF